MSRRCDCYLPERVPSPPPPPPPSLPPHPTHRSSLAPTAQYPGHPIATDAPPSLPASESYEDAARGGRGVWRQRPRPITSPAPNPVPAAAARRRRRCPTVGVSPRLIIRRPDTSSRARPESLIDAGSSEDVRGESGGGGGRCPPAGLTPAASPSPSPSPPLAARRPPPPPSRYASLTPISRRRVPNPPRWMRSLAPRHGVVPECRSRRGGWRQRPRPLTSFPRHAHSRHHRGPHLTTRV